MASPQIQNGYTKIADELIEALAKVKMSGTEWQFLMCIIRKTYGYNKKEDWITGSQIVTMTGLKKERVSEAKKRLLSKKIVTEKRNKISIQKDYEQWKVLRKSVTVVTEKRNKVLRKSVNTKDNKDTYTKDTSNQGLQLTKSSMKESKINLVPDVIKLFESVDPKNKTYYKNTTQREACLFLLNEYGFEEIEKRLIVLPKTNSMEFFPTITTPCQLRDKWVQLDNAIKRKHSEVEQKNNVVAF